MAMAVAAASSGTSYALRVIAEGLGRTQGFLFIRSQVVPAVVVAPMVTVVESTAVLMEYRGAVQVGLACPSTGHYP
jgi:hypothetical protein